jgi:hypothetical protein
LPRAFGAVRGVRMAVKGENPGARQWHQPLVRHFEEAQQRKREWINFAEIAKWRSELDGSAEPNEIARESAYKMLESDLLEGVFEERGRSQVLFLCSGVSWTHRKMTRQWLQDAIDHNLDGDHGRFYFAALLVAPRAIQTLVREASSSDITTSFRATREHSQS